MSDPFAAAETRIREDLAAQGQDRRERRAPGDARPAPRRLERGRARAGNARARITPTRTKPTR